MSAHAVECYDSTRCDECAEADAPFHVCEVCEDTYPADEGCRHDGHAYCGSCFVEKCAECRDDLRESLREVRD